MLILLTWSVSNISYWIKNRTQSKHVSRYVVEMSGLWNIINAAIAVFALYTLKNQTLTTVFIDKQQSIIAWNVFADIMYVLFGYILTLKKPSNRRKGYGIGLIVQGGFLLVFDAVFLSALVIKY